MGDCYTASFLGVILEVSLDILICVVSDDLDGVLVCTDCTITTETPELTFDCSRSSCVRTILVLCEGEECNIIVDADCELLLRLILLEFIIYGEYRCWSCILASETIASADDLQACLAVFSKSCNNIQVKWFAKCTWFLCSVKDSDALTC